MRDTQTITEFFEQTLGAPLKNPRWSWGAINPSTRDVYLRVWDDQRESFGGQDCVLLMGPRWNGPGLSERREHIQAFQEGSRAYAVLCTAQDSQDDTRRIRGFDSVAVALLGKVIEVDGMMYAEIAEFVPIGELVQVAIGTTGAKWTRDELGACVDAYLAMLRAEHSGEAYSKSAYNEHLRLGPLSARTKASIEYRMQNISAVLDDLGLSRIQGYMPARNVGSGSRSEIAALLERRGHIDSTDYEDTADEDELQRRAASLRAKGFGSPPKGNQQPRTTANTGVVHLRSPAVRAWVLDAADGVCELCSDNAPFITSTGEPFLEVHHVVSLAEGGPDTPGNAVALCPNCHRRCHYAGDSEQAREVLYEQVHRLER